MSTEMRLSAGCQGDQNTIWIDWLDEDGMRHHTKIEVNVDERDKPRTLRFLINGKPVATAKSWGTSYPAAVPSG